MTSTVKKFMPIGLILLVALMPFHAFLSVWLGSVIGHQSTIQAWKELLITLMTLGGIWIIYKDPSLLSPLKKPVNYLIVAFALVALLVTLFARPELKAVAFGLKTDLEFLVVFILAQLIASKTLGYSLAKALVAATGVVIAFGVLQALVLPKDFLVHFGYGPATIQPYLLVDPLLNSFRILSTLGGPNQLGSFLILPTCIVIAMLLRHPRWWHPVFLLGAMLVEWFTYSRSGIIGMTLAVIITIILCLPRKLRGVGIMTALTLVTIGSVLIIQNLQPDSKLQYYVLHGSVQSSGIKDSTDKHLDSLQAALAEAGKTPLGHGLGTAGPASFHSNRPDITENYYLQLAIETGLIGLILFLGITTALGLELFQASAQTSLAIPILGALVGISTVNLFLHGWADSSTALTFWAYAGAIIGARK